MTMEIRFNHVSGSAARHPCFIFVDSKLDE